MFRGLEGLGCRGLGLRASYTCQHHQAGHTSIEEMISSEDEDSEDEVADAKGPGWHEALPACAVSDTSVERMERTTSDCRIQDHETLNPKA